MRAIELRQPTEAGLNVKDSATRRRIIYIVSVMALAFSTGHIMQNVLARDTDVAARGALPDAEPNVRAGTASPSLPVPPAATLTPFDAPDVTPDDLRSGDPATPELPVLPLEDASLGPRGEIPVGMTRRNL
ncbi:MAG: hypothetical protein HKP37_10585 [Boseongicola sp.]|nr:hypothetical protein [Boseongicola sp.]